ncbi:zinc ribbon domain-containing protein [Aeromicrobium massiliense]|uniref:zinc ribbon domain-containing protein n=2 Tax=Aeromicrobium massiliense TaxID=1464554 RepID=UPI003CCB4C3A
MQAQDSQLAHLAHRKASLPEHARIDELTARAAELDGRRVEAETAVSDLTRDQKKAESEVEQVRVRRQRDEQRLNSGAISNPKDLESLQRELAALDRRIATLEDEELVVMEDLEQAQAVLADVMHDVDEVEAALRQARETRDAALAEIEQDVSVATLDRGALVERVPGDLLGLYDKLRAQYGAGAGALRARRCEACRLELNGADLREIAAAPDDEVVRCPECSRILVRTSESGL